MNEAPGGGHGHPLTDGATARLLRLLTVEEVGPDRYEAPVEADGTSARLFGGQVVAQALAAVGATVDAWLQAHSLHAYFLRAGAADRPVRFQVSREHDGGSFANRRAVALQGDTPILNLSASFHRSEPGFAHGLPPPELPGPEGAMDLRRAGRDGAGAPLPAGLLRRLEPFEVRVAPMPTGRAGGATQAFWVRLADPAPLPPATQRVLLGYLSDFALVTTAVLPHGTSFFSPTLQGASLDHAIWFHETPDLGGWLLYAMESPWAGHARGLARGSIFDRAGRLVASVAQEGLMRQRLPKGDGTSGDRAG